MYKHLSNEPLPKFKTYSDFIIWGDEHYDEVEFVLNYDDWSVILMRNHFFYYEHEVEGSSDTFFEVYPVATLCYNVTNDIRAQMPLYEWFDCDMCGEQITDDQITYWWFKELEQKNNKEE